ncbi:MAG TPA: DinB family protein [Anaerolineales bacterium]|nr:DinB family protein [Anaerolineales bacterium]HNO31229.1 DinB family protein [Anaerolineales bacterium]
MMISSDILNPVIRSAFTKQVTWLEAANRFSLDELIETFYDTRERTHERLQGLSDKHVDFSSDVHSFWSISESITHLIYTQGFYHNKLLDLSATQIPHIVEAAKGFGEGAKAHETFKSLRVALDAATERIQLVIEHTRQDHDPERTEIHSLFGACNYKTWILLLLAHEMDHLRQIAAMRTLAKTSPGE